MTSQGGAAKVRSWTRVRRNDAFGAHAQDFLCLTVETRHFDTYSEQFGYISDTYQCALASCLEAVPQWCPPPQYPPYDYSSLYRVHHHLRGTVIFADQCSLANMAWPLITFTAGQDARAFVYASTLSRAPYTLFRAFSSRPSVISHE